MLWYSGRMEHTPVLPGEEAPLHARAEVPTPAYSRAIQHDKILAYGRGLSYEEFVRRSSRYAHLLRTRYDETRLGPAVQFAAVTFPDALNILAVISEEDPDTLAVLPIVARLADAGTRLRLRILCD